MRSALDQNRAQGLLIDGALFLTSEQLAISANFTMTQSMPHLVALDPASTGRNLLTYTPSVTALYRKHEIINISTGTGVLTVKAKDGSTTIGTVAPGQRAELYWNGSDWVCFTQTKGDVQTVGARYVIQQYTLLAALANSQVMSVAIPSNFTLVSVGFRTRVVASTAAKLATLTAQVNGSNVTGGVVSLTTANQNTSGGLTAGTAITAGNTGTAGQTVGVAVSAVTAFAEGDGYVEYVVANTSVNQ